MFRRRDPLTHGDVAQMYAVAGVPPNVSEKAMIVTTKYYRQ